MGHLHVDLTGPRAPGGWICEGSGHSDTRSVSSHSLLPLCVYIYVYLYTHRR